MIKYRVKTLRDAGLEAKSLKTSNGAPYISVRKPGTKTFWQCNQIMFDQMKKHGIMEGFENSTLLGPIFNIPA